jgi:hypothetical protein
VSLVRTQVPFGARACALVVSAILLLPRVTWAQAGPLAPPFYQVTVTPDGGSQPIRAPNTGPYIASYTVTNTGGLTDTWFLSVKRPGS